MTLDELALVGLRAGAEESDESWRAERPPPCLCGLGELEGHRRAGRIAEAKGFRSPVASSIRLFLTG